ncbi:unnamed protein product [Caenorhabditis brenneri]
MSFVMNNCELSYQVTYDPLYRYSQIFTLISSTISVLPLSFILYKLRRSTFHSNVRLLYMLYFSQILLSVINNVVVFGHHVIVPFLADTNCDLLIDPLKNRVLQTIGIFGVSCPMLTILGTSVERLFALVFASCYEHASSIAGVAIAALTMIADVVIIVLFLRNERFDQPSISYFMIPETSGYKMNILCWSLLLANALNLIFNFCLVKANTILKEKWRTSLSVRYQMEENIVTTKFSTFISFLHVFFFSLYLGITLCIRYIGPKFLTTPADLLSVRGVYITIPTYNLLIGIASCLMLRHLQGQKVAKVYAETTMDYSGMGSKIHNEAIFNIWQTKSTKY